VYFDNDPYKYILHIIKKKTNYLSISLFGGRRGRHRMVVGFITTYAISAYHQ
jgi:hypothetical protein